MSTAGKLRRDFVKSRMATLAAGGTVETDVEQMQGKQALTETMGAGTAAQQAMLNQAAAANAAGAPVMAGALKNAAGQVSQQTQGAAVKVAGEAAQRRAALRDQREGATLASTERLIAQNRADAQMAISTGLGVADILAGAGQSAASP